MQLEYIFIVLVIIDEVWIVFMDIEWVVPCMFGAGLDFVDGDNFIGMVKVKFGLINFMYKGKVSFVEKDVVVYCVVFDVHGCDVCGNGTAVVKVIVMFVVDGVLMKVDVIIYFDIIGKPV